MASAWAWALVVGVGVAAPLAFAQCGNGGLQCLRPIIPPFAPRTEGMKRHAFRNWGGKRSSSRALVGLPLNLREVYLNLFQHARPQPAPAEGELKHTSFTPWGGKRSDPAFPAILSSPTKGRSTFSSWGRRLAAGYSGGGSNRGFLGEGAIPYVADAPNEEGEAGDDNWGPSSALWGDRGAFATDNGSDGTWAEDEPPKNLFLMDGNLPLPPVDLMRDKREAESQSYAGVPVKEGLHGTENFDISSPASAENKSQEDTPTEAKRVRFSAWAGKRLDLQAIQNVVRKWMEHKPRVAERRAFNAWAGKRSDSSFLNMQDNGSLSAYAGKRFNDDANEPSLTKKTRFSAWAGKRSQEFTPDDTASFISTPNDESFQGGINDDLKRTFNAWAGKRSNDDDKERAFNEWDRMQSSDDKRQAFNAWAGKRSNGDNKRQAFNAWAGKRSNNDEKRQAFNAWAGKRSNNDEKRQAFNAWAGKRSNNDEKRQAFNAWAGKRSNNDEKRQAFNAWAGKRSNDDEKRQAFNAWAGKRSNVDEKRQAFNAWAGKRSINDDKRQAFNAWAGKRSNENDKQQDFNAWADEQSNNEDKRQAFSAWAGKRSNNDDKRQAFSAWAGKRGSNNEKAFNAWAGKPGDSDDKRQAFSAWAGKRSSNGKRQSFSAWAGKRIDDEKQAFNSGTNRMDLNGEDETDTRPEERRTFGVWEDKGNDEWQDERDSQQISTVLQHLHRQRQELLQTRASFNSWVGKWVPSSTWGERPNPVSEDSQITDLVLKQL